MKNFSAKEVVIIILFVTGIVVICVVFNKRISQINAEMPIFN